jgi:hypothetical protein
MQQLFRLLTFLNQPYTFRATNSPILRSTFWLYVQLLVQCADTAADRCHTVAPVGMTYDIWMTYTIAELRYRFADSLWAGAFAPAHKLSATLYGIYPYWTALPGYRPATSWLYYTTSCNTQSSAPEDGRDQRPKHVELIGIIDKPLLLHLVGVHTIYINDARSNKYQIWRRIRAK